MEVKKINKSPGWWGSSWSDWSSPAARTPTPWCSRCRSWPSPVLLLLWRTEGTPESNKEVFKRRRTDVCKTYALILKDASQMTERSSPQFYWLSKFISNFKYFKYCEWVLVYLRSQVQHQVFDHLPERLGESQQLVEVLVPSPEADDVHHPHTLMGGAGIEELQWNRVNKNRFLNTGYVGNLIKMSKGSAITYKTKGIVNQKFNCSWTLSISPHSQTIWTPPLEGVINSPIQCELSTLQL